VAGVAQVDRAAPGEGLGGAARPGRHHAIEHVDAAQHGADDVERAADPHQIARPIDGQARHRHVEGGEHRLLPLADREPPHRVAVEADPQQGFDRLGAQVGIDAALGDAKQAVAGAGDERRLRAHRPAHRQAHAVLGLLLGRREGGAFVEGHGDVGIQPVLDLHRPFGAQMVARPVMVRLEGDAGFVELAQLGKAHHLEAAGIGQDRPRPVHEAVQAAQPLDPLGGGAQHQVIGVAQKDLRPGRRHRFGGHRLHRRLGADRHEGRGVDRPVRGVQAPQTGVAVPGQKVEAKSGHRQSPAGSSRQASP